MENRLLWYDKYEQSSTKGERERERKEERERERIVEGANEREKESGD